MIQSRFNPGLDLVQSWFITLLCIDSFWIFENFQYSWVKVSIDSFWKCIGNFPPLWIHNCIELALFCTFLFLGSIRDWVVHLALALALAQFASSCLKCFWSCKENCGGPRRNVAPCHFTPFSSSEHLIEPYYYVTDMHTGPTLRRKSKLWRSERWPRSERKHLLYNTCLFDKFVLQNIFKYVILATQLAHV